jgi:hypothetical protein
VAAVRAIAARDNLSQSDVLRRLVRRALELERRSDPQEAA